MRVEVLLAQPQHFLQPRLIGAQVSEEDGVLTGLGFKLAAALLKTMTLTNWRQIEMFVTVLAIRTSVKQIFNWEAARIRRRAVD